MLVYADDFESVIQSPQAGADSIGATVGWADAFRVELCFSKSWWWATRPEIPPCLAGACLGRKTCERELGADVSYGKKSSTTVQQGRCEKYVRLCNRIASMPVPAICRGAAITMKASPRVIYGVVVTVSHRASWHACGAKLPVC